MLTNVIIKCNLNDINITAIDKVVWRQWDTCDVTEQ